MVWEEDHGNMARALVKARVTGLDEIPWFFNFSEGETPESDSWTLQCEIISTTMLGAQHQDEDFPPDDLEDIDPNHFEFFAFGQPGQDPQPPPDGPPDHNQDNQEWPQWLNQNAPQQLDQNHIVAQPNEAPVLIPLLPVHVQQDHENDEEHLVMPVEEVIQNNQFQPADPPLVDEQVLAMDDDTDTDSDVHPQAHLPIPSVEIIPFPNFDNLQPLMPEELQEEVLGWLNELENPQQLNNNDNDGHAILQMNQQLPHAPDQQQLAEEQLQNLAPNLDHEDEQQPLGGFDQIQLGFVQTFIPQLCLNM